MEQISAAISNESLQLKMSSAFSSETLQKKLCNFVQAIPVLEDTGCHTYTVTLHRKLISTTIASLLTLSFAGQVGKHTLPYGMVVALINKQRDFPSFQHNCSHYSNSRDRNLISLFEQGSTPYTGEHLQDWKNRLKSELDGQGGYQRDLIMRSVAQICQDLDTRCNTVEEPLRQERERSKELEQRLAQLNEQISCLETEKIDDRFHLEGIEYDKEKITREKEVLAESFGKLKLYFAEAKRNEAETLRTMQEDIHAKEMELQSTILRYEESACSRERELESLKGTLSQLKEDQKQQDQDQLILNEQFEQLQARLKETEYQLEGERGRTCTQAEALTQLETRFHDLEIQLQTTETDLEITNRKLGDLEVSHQELIHTSEEVLRETVVKYENETNFKVAQAEEERNVLNDQLQKAIETGRQLKDVYETTRRDLQVVRGSVPPLETEIQKLKDLCSEQEDELEELRTLRKNVLASMGLASQNPLPIRSSPQSSSDAMSSATSRKPREHRRRKSAFIVHDAATKVAIGSERTTETACDDSSNRSLALPEPLCSDGSGTIPKRLKGCQSFKVPEMRTSYMQKPVLDSRFPSKKLSPKKRTALRPISPNCRHTSVGFVTSVIDEEHQDVGTQSLRKRRGSFEDIEKSICDLDDFLVGTPGSRNFLPGTGKAPDEEGGTIDGF